MSFVNRDRGLVRDSVAEKRYDWDTTKRAPEPRIWRSATEGSRLHHLDERKC